MPSQKIPNGRAVFSGLDKITGRIISFDAAIGETVQFGALQVTARVCYTRPPTEPTNTDAFIDVDEVTLQGEIKRIFTGWIFASSPGLHAVEHPIYDVWLSDCASPLPMQVAQPAVQPAPALNPARAPAPSRPRQVAPPRQQPAPPIAPAPRAAAALAPVGSRKPCESGAAGNRPVERQRAEIGRADQRGVEELVIGRPRDLDGAKCAQMIGDELGVEEPIAAGPEPRHQVDEGDFRRIAGMVEHALAEEGAAEADAIEAADQLAVLVHFNGVAVAALIELAVQIADARVDPGAAAPGLRLRATGNDAVEVAIDQAP